MLAQHHHHCQPHLRLDAGRDYNAREFLNRYDQECKADFQHNCVGCCLAYLTTQRQYDQVQANNNQVFYARPVPNNTVTCFMKVPERGGRRPQISTLPDLNLGALGPRPFAASRTYQIYNPQGPPQLTLGVNATVRVESIAEEVVSVRDMAFVDMNYIHATLLELLREHHDRPSLVGVCHVGNNGAKTKSKDALKVKSEENPKGSQDASTGSKNAIDEDVVAQMRGLDMSDSKDGSTN
eukprot:TRINITY_DN68149_c0_g3_i1.p1 TRINITY_DN68149_c0_g3~~TRINITY_DN68149_c0_g3_i1.p1  ORF type:complete len:238 (+),score=40.79 TRINITY_DN68149_c0_g3_i1:47-760(+)